MKWLLWREYRLNRLILITGLLLLLLPYLIALIVFSWASQRPEVTNTGDLFASAAVYSIVLSQLTLALLGGNSIAGERADRSAEFMAYLPLSRPRLLASKLSLTLATAAVIWGVSLLAFWAIFRHEPTRLGYLASIVAITGLTFYGVGWLVSSFQSSPTFATCAGLLVPIVIFMALGATAQLYGWSSLGFIIGVGYAVACLSLAVVCFSSGTWYYLRRVEP